MATVATARAMGDAATPKQVRTAWEEAEIAIEEARLAILVNRAIMEQMCEWGLEKGAGRTEEEVESWVTRRKVKRGEDVTCPVCLEEMVEGEEVGMVGCPCQHPHHRPCLTKWLRGHDTCPYCRGSVNSK